MKCNKCEQKVFHFICNETISVDPSVLDEIGELQPLFIDQDKIALNSAPYGAVVYIKKYGVLEAEIIE